MSKKAKRSYGPRDAIWLSVETESLLADGYRQADIDAAMRFAKEEGLSRRNAVELSRVGGLRPIVEAYIKLRLAEAFPSLKSMMRRSVDETLSRYP